MNHSLHSETLQRIQTALEAARNVLSRFTAGAIEAEYKIGHDPVTAADRQVDGLLRENLLRNGEGWLSEESVDDTSRLTRSRVWVVDPLDGTREFVAGIPEFCVSIAMVEDGRPVAGGICNPATNEIFLGSLETGVAYNGEPARASQKTTLDGALVLASRSEVKRGEWKQFVNAYKLALVSAGLADATFTLTPKNEWDVAAGAALVQSAGGFVRTLNGFQVRCNNKSPLLPGLLACGPLLRDELVTLVNSVPASARRS